MSIPSSHAHGSARLDEASEQYLKQLGRIALASSRLEATCRAVVAGMKVDAPQHPTLDSALAEAEAQARDGMPPWATVSTEEMTRWIAFTRHLLDERDRVHEALATHRFTGSDGDAPRVTGSDGTVYPGDERYLDRMITRLHRHDAAGLDLGVRLEYVDPKGTSWPLAAWQLQYRDPEQAESMGWYAEHLVGLPSDWRSWLTSERSPLAAVESRVDESAA